jgi:hypothetical protein
MRTSRQLRFIPRSDFVKDHFPQAKCPRCPYRAICQVLLSVDPKDMQEDYWLVRGDGECARDSSPADVRLLQEYEMARLSEIHDEGPEPLHATSKAEKRLQAAVLSVREKNVVPPAASS